MHFYYLLTLFFSLTVFASNTISNDLPARIQWKGNKGYCGETCLIIAGLYYGQYMSQYDVRALTSDCGSQFDQLLVGVNDKKVAKKMHLIAEEWDFNVQKSTEDFLAWIKQNVTKGHPVIIGLYLNHYLMYGDSNPDAGDPDYDHIVPIVGFSTNYDVADPHYYPDDILHYTDDGLWSGVLNHEFSSLFQSLPMTRQQANKMSSPIYSLPQYDAGTALFNYGVVIKGIKDENGDTFPIRLETHTNGEAPPIGDKSHKRPPAAPIVLTVTVFGLEPNTRYNLYKYTHLDDVPESNFNANASKASGHWVIQIPSGSTFSVKETIQSDQSVFYRAVKDTAP